MALCNYNSSKTLAIEHESRCFSAWAFLAVGAAYGQLMCNELGCFHFMCLFNCPFKAAAALSLPH